MTIAVQNAALTTITGRRSVAELTREAFVIDPYDPGWPDEFKRESIFLRRILPKTIVGRIEHIGSTAVQGLAAKPIIDLLVEVTSYNEVEEQVVPMLESQGYEYYWRNDLNPGHAWFIKRNVTGTRTHHIHMAEADAPFWVRLYFRDYLREFPQEAKRYEILKYSLAKRFPNDREAYTGEKTHFIVSVTKKAREYYLARQMLDEYLSTFPSSKGPQIERLIIQRLGDDGDDQETASCSLDVILSGNKRASTSILWSYEANSESLPEIGELCVITDWERIPRCLIEVTDVEICPFKDVDEAHAYAEGGFDKTLESWHSAHWPFVVSECEAVGKVAAPDTPLVLQRFKVVYPINK